ncbi:unnamed protein product [Gadus morhua 'NCC']
MRGRAEPEHKANAALYAIGMEWLYRSWERQAAATAVGAGPLARTEKVTPEGRATIEKHSPPRNRRSIKGCAELSAQGRALLKEQGCCSDRVAGGSSPRQNVSGSSSEDHDMAASLLLDCRKKP